MKGKDTKKGILNLAIIVIVIAAMLVVVFVGIGKHHKGKAEHIKLGLDLAGGVSITYQAVKDDVTQEQLADTTYRLQQRADLYSTESAVYQEGENRINIDIPGVTDANAILEELGKAGSIQFVESDGAVATLGQGMYYLQSSIEELYEQGKVIIDGADIATAKAVTRTDGITSYEVQLTLNESGKKKFAEATTRNVNKQIAIVYDGAILINPSVNEPITDGVAVITGQNSFAEAEKLASTIRIGALPVELEEIRSNVVGAKLGSDAIRTSLLAGIIGFVLILLFMIIYYRLPGAAASIALVMYVAATLLVLNGMNVTLTLPGIAGIILSIGMAVDANVIIFTRIREEIATGKTVRSAIKLGFDKALSAIIDGNVTTLIAAAVLWFKGSGTVKGFAQTLAIGIILSMFTALFVTKFILNALYNLGLDKEGYYGVQKPVKVINFVGNMKKYFLLSGVVILIGIGALIFNKSSIGEILNYGLDFKGGTSTEVTFNEETTQQLKDEVAKLIKTETGENAEISTVQGTNALLIKTKELSLDKRKAVESKLIETYGVEEKNIATESISGSVSDEMKSDAVWAVIIATICMLIYIWIRFKDINFGASAVIALIHDVLVVLMVYAVLRISVGNTFIACMLTIVGYSINATIVIFDRIRENKAVMRSKDTLDMVVNNSISQTISRSINTSLTTLIMVLVLAILGVDAVREFAIPLLAGIICGAYSSICITGTIWYVFKAKLSKKKA